MQKKGIVFVILTLLFVNLNFADEDEPNLYMVIANVIFDEFPFPLIGFANISMNNQILPQIGFVNYNDGDFKSLQMGFTNTVKGDMVGAQIGFSNVALGKFSGLQLGFFNYVDTLEKGIPIGFVSYVKNGGYHALELSITETSFINFSLKMGIEPFYTSLIVAYDPDAPVYCSFGFGIGSKIAVYKSLFINPELNYISNAWGGNRHYISGTILLGYNILRQLSMVLGPEFTLQIADDTIKNPVYTLYDHAFGGNKSVIIGGKLGIRFEF
jgi:hypothetical protein